MVTTYQIGGSGRRYSINPKNVKVVLAFVGLGIAIYILGPPLYWHLAEAFLGRSYSSCPSCNCDCPDQPLIAMPEGTDLLDLVIVMWIDDLFGLWGYLVICILILFFIPFLQNWPMPHLQVRPKSVISYTLLISFKLNDDSVHSS